MDKASAIFVVRSPGPSEPVGLAWVSPIDGTIEIEGWIEDAHPAGLDGVSYRLEKLAQSELGLALHQVSPSLLAPLPDPGPEPTIPVAYAAVEGEIADAKMHLRGDPQKLGEPVARHWIQVLGGQTLKNPKQSGRVELADWISQHPLTARVMVNRIWQWHFGQGLVRTPNDFGSRGELPIHRELLDELAAEFIRSGYSIRAMHRLMMNTEAYQRACDVPEAMMELDPENRYLARFARRRLTAEEIRDSLLVASDRMDFSIPHSHPFPPESTWTFTQHAPFNAEYSHERRSIFLMVQRQRRHSFLSLFDGADPNSSTSVRQTTTVPTQSLFFMNDSFFHDNAKKFAERITLVSSAEERIKLAYRLAYQRLPTSDEVSKPWGLLKDIRRKILKSGLRYPASYWPQTSLCTWSDHESRRSTGETWAVEIRSGRNDALSRYRTAAFVGRSNHDPARPVYAASSPFPGESKASHFPLYDRGSFPCR